MKNRIIVCYLGKATERLLQKTINKISNEFDIDMNSKEICRTIYAETRNRYHFGKLAVEEYFSNKFLLMPFFDPELNKLKLCTNECGDHNLLFALIYLRYCPELLNFKFEGNRKIDENTLDYAQKINEISPFTNKMYSYISGPEIDENCLNKYYDINQEYIRWETDGYYIKWDDVDNYLRNIFKSRDFKKEFEKYFSNELYYDIYQIINQETYFPLQRSYPAFAVLKIINDVQFSQNRNKHVLTDWFESFDITKQENYDFINSKMMISSLLNYITLRIDIKNNSIECNTIKLIENSDDDSTFNFPAWFTNHFGKGLVLESKKGKIKIKFQCINDGVLEIRFRGKDVRDKQGNRFPIYIDLTNVVINGNVILNENKLVWHDEPFLFKKEVIDGEIISIDVEWMPFTNLSSYNKV